MASPELDTVMQMIRARTQEVRHTIEDHRLTVSSSGLSKETFETQVAKGSAWVGTPEELKQQIHDYQQATGGFGIASMQVNFNTISVEDAEQSMRLFSAEVIPHFQA